MSPITIGGKQVFCGYARGKRNLIQVPIGGGEIFERLSGKFVIVTGNVAVVPGSDPATLFGWAEVGEFTSAAAAAGNIAVDISLDSQYWIPANAAVTEAVRGEVCALKLSGNTQQADVGTAGNAVLLITEVDIANQMVMVKIAEGKQQATAVA